MQRSRTGFKLSENRGNYSVLGYNKETIKCNLERGTIEGDVQLCGELDGIKRTAGKVTVANLDGGNFAAAVIDAKDQVLGVGIVFDINFAELQAAIFHKRLSAAAIRAPGGGIHDDRFGWYRAHK